MRSSLILSAAYADLAEQVHCTPSVASQSYSIYLTCTLRLSHRNWNRDATELLFSTDTTLSRLESLLLDSTWCL